VSWVNKPVDEPLLSDVSTVSVSDAPSTLVVTAYFLYFKLQNGENIGWQELRLPGERSSYLFENLRCGSRYQFYVVAVNAVDKSEPSEVITAKTDGMGKFASLSSLSFDLMI
jgi:hypothetical protein